MIKKVLLLAYILCIWGCAANIDRGINERGFEIRCFSGEQKSGYYALLEKKGNAWGISRIDTALISRLNNNQEILFVTEDLKTVGPCFDKIEYFNETTRSFECSPLLGNSNLYTPCTSSLTKMAAGATTARNIVALISTAGLGCGSNKVMDIEGVAQAVLESGVILSINNIKNEQARITQKKINPEKNVMALTQQFIEETKKNAESGDVEAQFTLGGIYDCRKDYSSAYYWYRNAASHGHIEAMSLAGAFLIEGKGVQPNAEEGMQMIQKAAGAGSAEAQSNLAILCITTKDYPNALLWAERSATQGYDGGQFILGRIYQDGFGVTKDMSKAIRWFKLAAEQENPKAQSILALIYYHEDSTTVEDQLAFYWMEKAAENNVPDAQFLMGSMFARGKGTIQDFSKSYMWLWLANQNGYAAAAEKLQILRMVLTSSQIDECVTLAKTKLHP